MSPAEAKVWAEYTPKIEAVRASEKEALESAFILGAPEFVDGVPIRRLTLGDWMLLIVADNAYGRGGEIKEEDVFGAMWILSLGFDAKDTRKRDLCFEALAKNHNLNALATGLNEMFDRAFLAAPLGSGGSADDGTKRGDPPKVGFVASIIHRIATSYHWSRQQILDTPLCELFQYLRQIEADDYAKAGKEFPNLGGKSDKMIMDAMEAAQKAKDEERAERKAAQL